MTTGSGAGEDLLAAAAQELDGERSLAALKLVESARKAALKRKDLEALGETLVVARRGSSGSTAKERSEWERLVYAIEQNIAFLQRARALKRPTLASSPGAQAAIPRGSDGREALLTRSSSDDRAVPLARGDGAGMEALRSIVDELAAAVDAHGERVKAAQSKLATAQQAYDRRVGAARKILAVAAESQKLAGGFFAGFGSKLSQVVLYDDAIKTPEARHKLTADVEAHVDTAGNLMVTRRHTLTRFVALGPFSLFAPKSVKHGDNELYMLIESSTWATVVKCDPKQGVQARKLAQAINLAARSADHVRAHRSATIAMRRRELAAAEADRSAVDSAAGDLAAAHSDTADVSDAFARARGVTWNEASRLLRRRAEKLAAKAQSALEGAAHVPELERDRAEGEAHELGSARAEFLSLLAQRIDSLTGRQGRDVEIPADSPTSTTEVVQDSDELGTGAAVRDAQRDPVELIRRLADLRDAGVLTEEEFHVKKAELLRRI